MTRRRLGFAAIYALQAVKDACEWSMATITDRLFATPPEARTRRHP